MAYPQYPQSGGFPAAPSGYGNYEQPAGGGTAIAAGVLALLGALWAVIYLGIMIAAFGAVSDLPGNASLPGWWWSLTIGMCIGHGVMVVLLTVGAIMLFSRKSAGRMMVIAGSAVAVLTYLIGFIVGLSVSKDLEGLGVAGTSAGFQGAGLVIFIFPPLLTAGLALAPLTSRWIAQGKRPQGMQPAYAQPGYAPPGGPGRW